MFNKQVGFQASSKISLSRKYDKNEASGKSKAKVDPNFKSFDQTFLTKNWVLPQCVMEQKRSVSNARLGSILSIILRI